MRKLIISLFLILFSIILLKSIFGYKQRTIEVLFDSNVFSTTISPDDESSTMCKIKLIGHSDCDLVLKVSGGRDICIPAGEVDFWKNYEWYNEQKIIRIEQKNIVVQKTKK